MDTDLYEKLLGSSFHFLSYRSRSISELRQFLRKKLVKIKDADISIEEKIINRLGELGYADDRAFALWWIESREAHSPKGIRVLEQELLRKGVSRDLIREVLASHTKNEAYSEYDNARKTIQKKLAVWGKLPKINQKMKLYGFLGRRGFSTQTISRIVDEVVGKDYNTPME